MLKNSFLLPNKRSDVTIQDLSNYLFRHPVEAAKKRIKCQFCESKSAEKVVSFDDMDIFACADCVNEVEQSFSDDEHSAQKTSLQSETLMF